MLGSSSVSEPFPPRNVPPKPRSGDCVGSVSTLVTFVLASGVVLTLVSGSLGRTCGSTRSARLTFERKQAERLAAMDRDEAAANAAAEKPKEAQP